MTSLLKFIVFSILIGIIGIAFGHMLYLLLALSVVNLPIYMDVLFGIIFIGIMAYFIFKQN